ncbi:MAG: KH domain-containing protein [Thomasclavelia sp.]|nr:KH domain-containing protein [Thomasclavelia sp.]
MKNYTGKNEQEAVNSACQDLGVTIDELNYQIVSETKSLFKKEVEISCYTTKMVQEYIENYVRKIISEMDLEVETVSYIQNDRIYCNINSSNNSILIGKGGVILRALTFIVRNAVSTTFKNRMQVSLDINGYKEDRYHKVAAMAKRFGKQVQRTKQEIKLDPMPADERLVMHQELSNYDHVKTESFGEGRNRHIVISYVD